MSLPQRRRTVVAAVGLAAVAGSLLVAPGVSGAAWGRPDWGGRGDRGQPAPPAVQAPAAQESTQESTAQETTAAAPPPVVAPAQTGDFWGDTGSIPAAQNVLTVKILNRTNGRYPDDQVFWSYAGQTHSIAEQPTLDLGQAPSQRMYFHLGSPDSQYVDFVEFHVEGGSIWGNTTRVDGFGLKLAMRIHGHAGDDKAVGENQATFAEDRAGTFKRFVDAVPEPFKGLAQGDTRIVSPGLDGSFRAGGAHAGYLGGVPLGEAAMCDGSVAGQPQYCAALNRGVGGLPADQWTDPSRFYQSPQSNWYAKFWHDNAIDGLAYGFSTDDQVGQSTMFGSGDPQWLLIAVGW